MSVAKQLAFPELHATAPPPVPAGPSLRPPLKWAGGKRWLVPHVRELWFPHANRRLVEPFCGGLAVTLGLSPKRALLNDINPHVINLYSWLKKGLVLQNPMRNDERFYYRARKRFNELIERETADSSEAAELFYYLTRTGYNGLCRFNRSGFFNVPFGRYVTINYRQHFSEYKRAFRSWNFTSDPFSIVDLDREDFVYADPPYDVEFTTYSKDGFSWRDQVKTAEWLSAHKGPVVLSNQSTTRIRTLYERLGYDLTFLQAPRRISCNGDRTPAIEVVATRNL
ncbi:MAG: Dam family site-specific DNA-(adenine-N6)-methyltransferase [Candidatus Koribacter versatilis]|uniref:Site-specific DNA-methyltransferase (adenine-specific) n=1 Tax=Candidatus Korobacter versatilis TaxID=658062 RepID=A0A932EQH1_9BACT|nr:Dam family site-specific DNA-(adenine-N6)-methyltransferase [Candidatus Koribacter versatilis]